MADLTGATLEYLRCTYEPAPGLLLHDWDEDAAVVFVPGTHSTHLVDGVAASLVADWWQPVQASETAAVARLLEQQIPTLLQTGILIHRPA